MPEPREEDIRARAAAWEPEASFGLHQDIRYLLDLIDRLRAQHDARVTELLAANSREVERRRAAEAALHAALEDG